MNDWGTKNRRVCDNRTNTLLSINSNSTYIPLETNLADYFAKRNSNVLRINCNERLNYKPWGLLIEIFKEYLEKEIAKDNEQAKLTKILLKSGLKILKQSTFLLLFLKYYGIIMMMV